MTNNGKDGLWEQVYHLMDDRIIVFTGTKEEIMEFEPCLSNNFYEAVRLGYRLRKKYHIKPAYMREVKEMMCGQCGEVKPVEEMIWRKRKDGSKRPVTVCKKCNKKEQIAYRARRKEKNHGKMESKN